MCLLSDDYYFVLPFVSVQKVIHPLTFALSKATRECVRFWRGFSFPTAGYGEDKFLIVMSFLLTEKLKVKSKK